MNIVQEPLLTPTVPTRVLVCGLGAMGSLMANIILQRRLLQFVAAVDTDPDKVGRDSGLVIGLGRPLGFSVDDDAENAIARSRPDAVLLATTAFAREAAETLQPFIDHGLPVISIVQELVYPIGPNVQVARSLDERAKSTGARLVAVGINPGFMMDLLPIVVSGACASIESITIERNVDFSPYGPDEMRHIGAGMTPEEFVAGVEAGEVGHIGLLESAVAVARCLSLDVDKLVQRKRPLVGRSPRRTAYVDVPHGRVCGFIQDVIGFHGGQERLRMIMRAVIDPRPDEDGFVLGDRIVINGAPPVECVMPVGFSSQGGLGTAAMAVNSIPRLLGMPPGLHLYTDLPIPSLGAAAVWTRAPSITTAFR